MVINRINNYNIFELIILLVSLTVVTYFDIKKRIVPDIMIIISIMLLVIVRFFIEKTFSFWIFVDLSTGFLVFFLLRIFSNRRLGMGDVKLSAFLAALLGIPVWIFSMLIASSSGIIIFLLMLLFGKIRKEESIAFAPFISFGAAVGFLFSPEILKLYII